MAYNYFEEEEKKDEEGSGGAQPLGSGSGIISGGPATQNPEGKGTSSGSFTNLQSYLDANRPQQFGSQVAGKVGEKVDQSVASQQEADTGFRGNVDAATVRGNRDYLEAIRNDPTQLVSDEEKKQEVTKIRDARYEGPNAFADSADLYNKTNQATQGAYQDSEASKTEEGRQALLDNYYGSGAGRYDYTKGQKSLDNMLVQNDPTSREAFAGVQGRATQAQQDFAKLTAALDAYAGQGKATTQQARADIRGALGVDDAGNLLAFDAERGNAGAIQDSVESIDERLAARKAQLAKEQKLLDGSAGYRATTGLSPEQMQLMGIDPSGFGGVDLRPVDKYGDNLPEYYNPLKVDDGYFFNVSPDSYLNFANDADLTRGSVSTADEQARLAALRELAGIETPFITDPERAGQFDDEALTRFNAQQFGTDVGAARDKFTREMQAVTDKFDAVAKGDFDGSGNIGSGGQGIVDPSQQRDAYNYVRSLYGLPPL